MKKITGYLSIFLLAIMLSFTTEAKELSYKNDDLTNLNNNEETVNTKEGFVQEGENVLYYIQGQPVKNDTIVIAGIPYVFDENGCLKLGVQSVQVDGKNKIYFYTQQEPYVFKGEKRIENKWYYFDLSWIR